MSMMFSPRPASKVAALLAIASFLALAFAGCAATQPTASSKYLYVLGCGATVDKIDTDTGRTLVHVDLRTKTDKIPDPRGHLDGCLANGVAYQPAEHRFYTAVPTSAQVDAQNTRQFLILSFSIPDLEFQDVTAIEGRLTDPPKLAVTEGGKVEIAIGEHNFSIRASGLQPQTAPVPLFQTDVNLFGFKGVDLNPYRLPNENSVPASIVEQTDAVAVVQLSSQDDHDVFAVADRGSREVTAFQGNPPTFPQNIHLAPGGKAVLVEEAKSSPDGSEFTEKTGKLILLNTANGHPLYRWNIPNLKDYQFLGISPSGKIIYHQGNTYRFVAQTGATYPNVPVYREKSVGPPVFFAAE